MNINKVYLGSRRGNNDEILLPPTGCQLSLQLILVQVQEEGSLTLELPINCMKSVQLDFYHLQTILCFFFPVSCVSAAEMSETRKRKQADSAPSLSKQPISSRSGLLVRYLQSKIKKLYIGKRFLVQCGYSLLSTQSSLCLILTGDILKEKVAMLCWQDLDPLRGKSL